MPGHVPCKFGWTSLSLTVGFPARKTARKTLCATCHVEVVNGFDKLKAISDDEYAMLDTLPNITSTSRLSCQLKLSSEMDGIKVKIMGDGH